MIPVNTARLGILNSVTSAKEKYLRCQQRHAELIQSMTGGGHSLTSTISWKLGKKGVTVRNTRMKQTKPNSGV